ncbi:hypothetical protein FKM82_024330 [Ascaphus truei]
MQFLKEQMLPAKTVSNLEDPGSQEETLLELSFVEEDPIPEPVASVSQEPISKQPRASTDLQRKMVQIEENKFGRMHSMMQNSNEEIDFF